MAFEVFPSDGARARIYARLGETLPAVIRPHIARASRTLAENVSVNVAADSAGIEVAVTTDYFWWGILDQGRASFGPIEKQVLIYFRNPLQDDPRLAGGYNRKYNQYQVRRLTEGEYLYWLARNAESPNDPPMIVRRSVGPFYPGRNFVKPATEAGNAALQQILREELTRDVREEIQRILRGFQ